MKIRPITAREVKITEDHQWPDRPAFERYRLYVSVPGMAFLNCTKWTGHGVTKWAALKPMLVLEALKTINQKAQQIADWVEDRKEE